MEKKEGKKRDWKAGEYWCRHPEYHTYKFLNETEDVIINPHFQDPHTHSPCVSCCGKKSSEHSLQEQVVSYLKTLEGQNFKSFPSQSSGYSKEVNYPVELQTKGF